MHSLRRILRSSICLCTTPLLVFTFSVLGLPSNSAHAQLDVWIDPGHGGNDPGALGVNKEALPNEKELNFAVTGYLENDLTGLGYFVYRTQNYTTTFFQPEERREIANGERPNDQLIQLPCRLLVSVHMNSVLSDAVKGTETYYATEKYDARQKDEYLLDKAAAADIHEDVMTYANAAFLFCSEDRGIKPNNLDILRCTYSPAILIEVCFISNACQFNNIVTSGDQALMADGIAAGVSQYLAGLSESPPRQQPPALSDIPMGIASGVSVTSLHEDFEGGAFPPPGWTLQTAGLGSPYVWHRTTDSLYVHSGNGSALVEGKSPAGVDEWLISPSVALTGMDHAIKFSWSGSHRWSSVLNASLNIREVGTSNWIQLWSLSSDEPAADPFIYRERVTDLTAWTGMTVELGFRVVGTNGADFAIDDIEVGDFNPTTQAPNDVCSNATGLAGTFFVEGVTCYAANDLDPYTAPPNSCVGNSLAGPDVFYEFNVADGDSLHATLVSEWGAGLYVIDGCLSPNCVVGAYAEDGRTGSVIDYRFVTAGTYYLVIDGVEGSCGPYQLDGVVVSTLTGVGGQGAVPPLVTLTVYPNPARAAVAFLGTFPLAHGAVPTLEIYNVAGERVLLVKGESGKSAFSFLWDLRSESSRRVGSGIYFARLRAGGREVVQKFVILR